MLFADRSAIKADFIAYSTGTSYTLRFPFLPDALTEIKKNGVELYACT